MADSILDTTKTSLGLAADYTVFDDELFVHINSVLANLNQLGIGPAGGFAISNATATWDDFLMRPNDSGVDPRLNHCKSYMHLKVKMLFDPPSLGYLITAYEKMILEAEWRITVAQDDVVDPLDQPTPVPLLEGDIVLDGGDP